MKMFSRKRRLVWIIVGSALVVIAGGATGGFFLYNSRHTPTVNPSLTRQTQPTKPENASEQPITVHVAAMGDLLAHDTIVDNAKTATGYDFGKYFQNIRKLYKDADVVFCNQEGLSAGEAYGISGYPAFNAPTDFSRGLQSGAGCNLINLANNHMGDKGVAATNATIQLWKSLKPLAFAGANESEAEQNTVRYAEVKGLKISLLSFADFNNNKSTPAYSINIYHDEALVRRLVTEARKNSDAVIVSMHWGTEDSPVVNEDQKQQVALLASLGVDVVIGTGPHVLQKTDVMTRPDGKPMTIWYSLGNMLSSQLTIPELFSGVAAFDIVKQPGNGGITIEHLAFTPTYMHYEWSASDEAASNFRARTNAMIYPLADAAEPLAKTRLKTTVDEQRAYMTQTLGPKVTVK